MSTWVEIAEVGAVGYPKSGVALTDGGGARAECAVKIRPRRLGTGEGGHSFAERLSRARLLYARRREALYNWLALSAAMFIVLAAPSIRV